MSYCIYLRKSRTDNDFAGYSAITGHELAAETLERHRKILQELSEKMGISVCREYREVVSGETISERPQMQKLLSDVEKGIWKGVLVMEPERLARGDTVDQGTIARAFKIHGTKIITPQKIYDPHNEFDEEYFEFGLFMARREYKAINRRIQRGRIASAKEGKFVSSVPAYGYRKERSPDGKGYVLAAVKQEASVVQRIFSEYISGSSTKRIAEKLTEEGIPPRKSIEWSPSSVRDILKNPVYSGNIRWSYKKVDKSACGGHKRYVSDDHILVRGRHEPIISEMQYELAKKRLSDSTKNIHAESPGLRNPLKGLIYCKACGMPMTRIGVGKKNKSAVLYCKTKGCVTVSAPLDIVEEKVINELGRYFSDIRVNIEPKNDRADADKSRIMKISEKLKKIEKRKNNICRFLEDGTYTKELFENRLRELMKEQEKLIAQNRSYSETLSSKAALTDKTETFIDLYGKCTDASSKNILLSCFVKRILYEKNSSVKKGEDQNFTVFIYPLM